MSTTLGATVNSRCKNTNCYDMFNAYTVTILISSRKAFFFNLHEKPLIQHPLLQIQCLLCLCLLKKSVETIWRPKYVKTAVALSRILLFLVRQLLLSPMSAIFRRQQHHQLFLPCRVFRTTEQYARQRHRPGQLPSHRMGKCSHLVEVATETLSVQLI